MFRYYQCAATCYAYLIDINNISELGQSRWFTRGWTLQELIAPKDIQFYSSDWNLLGSKLSLANQLQDITGIPKHTLMTGDLDNVNIATKMSWAANRQTTRREDIAYCLLGLFQVHMPLLYGEGRNAFIRLQQEIIKVSLDPSLFAWGLASGSQNIQTMDSFLKSDDRMQITHFSGIFASSPSSFSSTDKIVVLEDLPHSINVTFTGGGISISLPSFETSQYTFLGISCILRGTNESCICIPLFSWNTNSHSRYKDLVLVEGRKFLSNQCQRSLFIKPPRSIASEPALSPKTFTVVCMPDSSEHFRLDEVYCLPHASYSHESGQIMLSEMQAGPHAVFIFAEDPKDAGPVPKLFAIIIGGALFNPDTAWVTYVEDILNDDSAEPDFHHLLKYERLSIRFLKTRSQLKNLLEKHDAMSVIPKKKERGFRHLIKTWRGSYYKKPGENKLCSLYIDVELRDGICNFTERSMFVYIQISEMIGKNNPRKTFPEWWNYKVWETRTP